MSRFSRQAAQSKARVMQIKLAVEGVFKGLELLHLTPQAFFRGLDKDYSKRVSLAPLLEALKTHLRIYPQAHDVVKELLPEEVGLDRWEGLFVALRLCPDRSD
jgi:hypothetical protein